MALPKVVTVGPFRYRVEHDESMMEELSQWGHIRYHRNMIRIDPSADGQRQRVAVLHEALHAVLEFVGYAAEDWNESFVTSMSPAILDMLQRNPELVDYLMGDA